MQAFIILPYLAIGAVFSIIGYFSSTTGSLGRSPRMWDRMVDRARVQQQIKGFTRIQWEISRLLSIPTTMVTWPILPFLGARVSGSTKLNRASVAALLPWFLVAAVCTLGFASLLTILRLLVGPHWSINVGCAILLASLLASLIGSALARTDLPGQLRRNLMQPYVQFIFVAAADYLSLLLAAVLVERLQTGNEISREVILQQIRGMSAFTHVITAIRNTPLAPLTLLLTAVGVAYFTMIGRLVLQYRQFTRRPEDHAFIVNSLATSGKFRLARQWFGKQDQQTRNHSSMMGPRIWLDLEAREFDKAYQLMDAFEAVSGEGSLAFATKSADSVLYHLIAMAMTFGLNGSALRDLIAFTVERGISDAGLALILPAPVTEIEVKSPDELVDWGISKEGYPMATSFVMWLTTESSAVEDAAREQLASVVPSSKTDRLVQQYYLIVMALGREEQPIEAVEDLLSELTDVSDLPGWFRVEFSALLLSLSRNDYLEAVDLKRRMLQRRAALLEGANSEEAAWIESIGNVAQYLG
jgi:hypothetical protein